MAGTADPQPIASLQYDKVLYLVDPSKENQSLVGRRVTVIDFPDGRIKIRYEGR